MIYKSVFIAAKANKSVTYSFKSY